MEVFISLVAIVVGIAALVKARGAAERLENAQKELTQLKGVLENLARSVAELRKQFAARPADAAPPPSPAAAPQPPPTPVWTALAAPLPSPGPATYVASEPESQLTPATQPVPTAEAPLEQPIAAAESTPLADIPVLPPQPPPPPRFTPPPPRKSWFQFDWEGLVGVRLFTGIGAIAFVLAMILLLKYSADQGLLKPPIRAAMGLIAGAVLIFVCELRIARNYKVTANALHGAAIAVLYATLFASYARWHLIPATLDFGLMIVVTAVAVWLSIRRESVFIALLGLIGGFATPAMLSTGENRPIGLFTYLLLLNIGMAWVGVRRRWTVLTGTSLVFTAIYQWVWIAKFLTTAQLPLAAAVFFVFAIAAAVSLWLGRRTDAEQSGFDTIAVAGAALPLLFAAYMSSVHEYGTHYNILFGFLLLICGGLAAIAFSRGPAWLHTLGGVTTLLVFAIWRGTSFSPVAWPAILGWMSAFVALYLGVAVRWRTRAVFTAPGLLFLFPTFVLGGALAAKPGLPFTVLFVLLAGAAAYAIAFEEGLVYYIGTFAALATEALWSNTYLSKERLIPALALYGVFALFYLGVPLIAQRLKRKLEPQGAFTALVLLSIAMLFFLDGGRVADASLWGLTLLLAVLNAGALLQAHKVRFPILSILAAILSWLVIAVWWSAATITAAVLPALMAVGLFGVLIVAGNVWARSGTTETAPAFESSIYIALAGHLFLLFVAGQKSLALPPWPLFGVLFLLQLALGVAALWLRRERLLTAGSAASQVVLIVWAVQAPFEPWPNVALIAAPVIVGMTLVWYRLDRRFSEGAIVAAFAGQFVAMAAGDNSHTHLFGTLLLTHVLLVLALFLVAWISEQHIVVTIAAITTTIVLLDTAPDPWHRLAFAGAIYVLFLAYPLLLGQRAKQSLHPYLAAVLFSAAFFGFAYDALVDLGYKRFIGALPAVQAVLLMVLLLRLLKIDRPTKDMVGQLLSRLALMAGAVLAFITLAIPLQLDKEWITISWALEGAALIWLFGRIPHRGLLMWGGGLLAVTFVRLTLNPAVLEYHAPQRTAILNWYLYTYLVAAATMFAGGTLMPAIHKRVVGALHSAGAVLLFFLVNIEIADYFSTGPTLTFNFFSSSLSQDLSYTMGWALFAIGMLVAGIVLHNRASRVAAILLLVVTILKCFLHDLARLHGLYRIGSLFGLAISLIFVGLLLQKYVMRKVEPEVPAA
jgi:uncharacterized membrane protein